MSDTVPSAPNARRNSRRQTQRRGAAVVTPLTDPETRGHDTRARGRAPHETDADPLTDWLLERRELSADEFSVLFAVHKLGSRRRAAGWIARAELVRSTNLDQKRLSATVDALRQRGLLRARAHPRKHGWTRYMVVIA